MFVLNKEPGMQHHARMGCCVFCIICRLLREEKADKKIPRALFNKVDNGYYTYNDTRYYCLDDEWYSYDGDSWIPEGNMPAGLDEFSAKYYVDEYDLDGEYDRFESTDYYSEWEDGYYLYNGGSGRGGWNDNGYDNDWDSDDWDYDYTDWDSDW